MDEEFEKRLMQLLNSYNQDWCEGLNQIQDYFEKLQKDGGEIDLTTIMGITSKTGNQMMGKYSGLITNLLQIYREAKTRTTHPKKKGFF